MAEVVGAVFFVQPRTGQPSPLIDAARATLMAWAGSRAPSPGQWTCKGKDGWRNLEGGSGITFQTRFAPTATIPRWSAGDALR
jgi:hypothetical protein